VLKKISLLHPFSAKAIGLKQADLYYSHSKPHEKALRELQENYKVSIDYFTGSFFPFFKNINGLTKKFWPISKPLFTNKHVWRQQFSFLHFLYNLTNASDVTIINMSGHGSKYVFKLAEVLVKKKKPYIAMLGGIHISKDEITMRYYRNAHHLIVHTHVQRKELLNTPEFKKLCIKVMPLGVDTNNFMPEPKTTRVIKLLYVGRISRLKQIELCLETVAYLLKNQEKPIYLNIVGPVSDNDYYHELLNLCKNLEIESYVNFVGSIEQQDLVPFYQKANLLLLPSAHESFGMVMVEAMACGTPVAALIGACGPDELIVDEVNGLLSSKESYPKRILNYFKSKEKQQLFNNNSRKIVEEKWSLKQTESAFRHSIEMALSN